MFSLLNCQDNNPPAKPPAETIAVPLSLVTEIARPIEHIFAGLAPRRDSIRDDSAGVGLLLLTLSRRRNARTTEDTKP